MSKLGKVIVLKVPEGNWSGADYLCMLRTALALDAANCHRQLAIESERALGLLKDSARLLDLEAMSEANDPAWADDHSPEAAIEHSGYNAALSDVWGAE